MTPEEDVEPCLCGTGFTCLAARHARVHVCGYEEGSFACRIRHVHLNTGAAKAARDFERSKP